MTPKCEVHTGRGRTPKATHLITVADGKRLAACAACWVRFSDDARRDGGYVPYILIRTLAQEDRALPEVQS
jgi:hypothetical protein